jgi:hypothetical protein
LRRSTTVSALVLAGVIASPALLHAQANPTGNEPDATAVMDTNTVADRDDDNNWGWVGLLGLAGLLGLKRPDREKRRDEVRARQSI